MGARYYDAPIRKLISEDGHDPSLLAKIINSLQRKIKRLSSYESDLYKVVFVFPYC